MVVSHWSNNTSTRARNHDHLRDQYSEDPTQMYSVLSAYGIRGAAFGTARSRGPAMDRSCGQEKSLDPTISGPRRRPCQPWIMPQSLLSFSPSGHRGKRSSPTNGIYANLAEHSRNFVDCESGRVDLERAGAWSPPNLEAMNENRWFRFAALLNLAATIIVRNLAPQAIRAFEMPTLTVVNAWRPGRR